MKQVVFVRHQPPGQNASEFFRCHDGLLRSAQLKQAHLCDRLRKVIREEKQNEHGETQDEADQT